MYTIFLKALKIFVFFPQISFNFNNYQEEKLEKL